jgi:hypothetical protein
VTKVEQMEADPTFNEAAFSLDLLVEVAANIIR